MGEVYRARDLKLKRQVAIKILPEMKLDITKHSTFCCRMKLASYVNLG
jgi:hypothetical protein